MSTGETPAVKIEPRRDALWLESCIRNLGPVMVATLDERLRRLQRYAKGKCEELGWDLGKLKLVPERDAELLDTDERLLRELLRLIDYIEGLRR